jgi:hypothetical protein
MFKIGDRVYWKHRSQLRWGDVVGIDDARAAVWRQDPAALADRETRMSFPCVERLGENADDANENAAKE